MSRFCFISILLLAGMSCAELAAQNAPNTDEAQVGVIVPVTITGGVLDTRRAQADDPAAASFTVGFRVLATPQLKLGPHWYIYSAVQVRSTPFFYQDAYSADRNIETDVLQGLLGYARSWGKATLGFKVGRLPTAFGAFPLRYDDAANPLLDQPLPYTYLKLRPDQLPCGITDFSPAPNVVFHCGGGQGETYGVQPATLYGLPGAEIGLSWHRLDARFQLTGSSPANPRSLFASGHHPQWTAGTGYTIRQGFRVGMSAFRGPWLDNAVMPFLPPGSSVTDFPASGLGVDVQWARGPWSASGEWQRFVFRYPNFPTPPASSFGYVELKRIINPRWYSAIRGNYEANNHPEDSTGKSAATFLPNRQAYEFAVGFRPDRFQLLKVGYEWMRAEGGPRTHDNVFGVQFVTSIDTLSKAFK
jgi:hypothetical protein